MADIRLVLLWMHINRPKEVSSELAGDPVNDPNIGHRTLSSIFRLHWKTEVCILVPVKC